MATPAANSDHAKAAPGNRAALPRPGVDGDTGGQFRSRQSRAGRPGDNFARRRWRHRRPILTTPKPHRKADSNPRPASMVTPAANPDHAKAAPEGWQQSPPGVDGDTGGQFRSRQSCAGQPGGASSPWRRWRHRRPIPITPKPRRKAGRQSRPTSMAAPAVNLPAPISPHQSRAGRLAAIPARRRWRHRRPISQFQG